MAKEFSLGEGLARLTGALVGSYRKEARTHHIGRRFQPSRSEITEIVQILLELSRNGQQVVLATHDYVLLKWFDLLMDERKEDHVRFHSL